MKKLFALALVVFGLAACQTDPNELDVNVGGEVLTTVNISIPETTRATDSAQGAFVNVDLTGDATIRYILKIYQKVGEEYIASEDRQVKYSDGKSVAFDVRLVSGRDYQFVAWADYVDGEADVDKHYDTSDLTNVTLKDTWVAMDETRDAFTATKEVTYGSTATIDLTLTRPFAKLRVITTDMEQLNDLNIIPTKATVQYHADYDHYNAFNAFEGKAIANSKNRDITHENFTIKAYDDNVNDESKVLFTDYFFANNDVVWFYLTVYDQNGNDIGGTITFNTDINVKRNHLTTISGNILTDGKNVNVKVEDAFDSQYSDVETTESFSNALKEAEESVEATIELSSDVVWVTGAGHGSTPWIPEGAKTKKLTVNANGHKITATGAGVGAIRMANGGTLVINNATIEDNSVSYNEGAWELGYLEFGGNLEFNNCKFVNAIQLEEATATFNKCSFNSNKTKEYAVWVCGNKAYFNECTFEGPRGIKMHEAYGSEVEEVIIDNCLFNGISEKPGVAMGDLNADTKVEIKNSTFINCQAGDQNLYIYETDTDVTTFDFTEKDNSVMIPVTNAEGAIVEGISMSVDETTYAVTSLNGLEWVADQVDNGDTFEGKEVKLTEDITLPEKNWDPIGDNRVDGAAFSGTFDGQNHTISGAKITGDSCFNGAVYGSKEGWGLFSVLDGATVKNVKLDDEVFASYTVISGAVAGYAHDTTFENIDITNTKIAGYNWYTGGVVGWASGNCTFKDINLDDTVYVGTLWDSHGQNAGGIAGGVSGDGTYIIEDCNIACVMDVINDVTSNYKWWIYRVSGMIIGNTNTTEAQYNTVVTATATNVTCNNVTVTYGDWMNYHYCEGYWNRGWGRYESSDYVGGVDQNEPHNHPDGESHYVCVPFDQLFGGSSNGSGHYPVKGLAEFPGVTVNYPASYRREVSSAAALTEALGKGVSVVLGSDIDFGSTQLAITGENQVVDLGGHALTTANNWGGISLKNGATIKNGTITHSGNTAAIKAFNGSSVENVTINATCSTADKTVTGIAVQQGANVESIKNVTINGVSQGIEVGYQATVGLIENAVVNESNNGTAKGIGLVINGGKVGVAKDCTFKGETYGITMHLKGVFNVGLELQNCVVEGTTASIYAWDEKGVSNTSGSLNLTYDAATTLTGPFVWDFEEECQSVVTLNRPE